MGKDLKELEQHLERLKEIYIDPNSTSDDLIPDNQESISMDVRSYIILSHAAFEEYIESLGISLVGKIGEKWSMHHEMSISTLCLLSYFKVLPKVEDVTKCQYDVIREGIDNAKSQYSKMVNNNHGVGAKYLKNILLPVGVDVPADLENGSLDTLVTYRGEYAHLFRPSKKALKPKSPKDAATMVSDVLQLMKNIESSASKIVYFRTTADFLINNYNKENGTGFAIYYQET